MNDNKINLHFTLLTALILLAALSRLLPHPPNFTPVGGMALFGAAYFSRKYLAFLVPFVALWLSNLMLNNLVYAKMYPEFYEGFVWFDSGLLWVYVSFVLIAGLGFLVLKNVKPLRLLGASLGASVLFFIITNFGTWASGTMYAKTVEGLTACYVAAIPFFWNTLAGDLFYTAVLFGTFEVLKQRYPALHTQTANS